jgi:L-fuculose-phosphate aldolase
MTYEQVRTFEQARHEVVSTCLLLADKGYLAGTGGNVARRIDDEHFAITPSATDYYAMLPEDICVLRLDDLRQVAGDRRPSVELRLHANIMRAHRDCGASIHTHQPIASAYTLLRRDLKVEDPHRRAVLGAKAALVDYAPSGTSWLASKLSKTLRPQIHAYLMRNHGVVCCGPTLNETVARVEALEAECTAFFHHSIGSRMGREPYMHEILRLLEGVAEVEFAQ